MISNKFYSRIVAYWFACMIAIGPTLPAFAALPGGGKITTGKGSITVSGKVMTVKELSPTIDINWNSFNVGKNSTIDFLQPNSSSVAANFVGGGSASTIAGDIKANGKVFIFNPFGIAFLGSSKVDVAGLLAAGLKEASSTPNSITMTGSGTVSNAGTINVLPGGQVAIVGSSVSNSGNISAPDGLITFGAGNNVILDFSGNSILSLNVNSNTANATINNNGILDASGGNVDLKAGAANSLVSSAVNNTGNVEANSITVLSGMQAGVTTVGGSLYASGGQINTSGGRVNVLSSAKINTTSNSGVAGTWTIDPNSFYIGENTSGTANSTLGNVLNYEDISASSLETALDNSNVTILSTNGEKGTLGNVYVDSSISYNSSNEFKIDAVHNIEVNKAIVNAGTGEIRLRADDMNIGGTADNGVVNIANSVGTSGALDIFTNPVSYLTVPVNTANGLAYSNSGSGTIKVYDLISSINDLEYISNNQTTQVLSNNYALNTNIGWSTNTTYNFIPIGTYTTAYSGTFNGLNNAISNLYESNDLSYAGLFGQIAPSSTIKNLSLVDENIVIVNATSAGGLVGYSAGTVANVDTSGATISLQNGGQVGGLVGGNGGNIVNSSSAVAISSTASYAGGLVGRSGGLGIISYSHSSGTVYDSGYVPAVGGLVGCNMGVTTKSYSTAAVHGGGYSGSVGGLAGENDYGYISNSYSTGSVGGPSYSYVGGLVGDNDSNVFNSYAAGSFSTTGTGSTTGGLVGLTMPAGGVFSSYDSVSPNSGSPSGVTYMSSLANLKNTANTGWSWGSNPWHNLVSSDPVLVYKQPSVRNTIIPVSTPVSTPVPTPVSAPTPVSKPTPVVAPTPAYLKSPLTNPIPSLLPIPTEAIATSSAAVTAVTPAPEILQEGVGQNTIGQVQILKNGVKIK